MKKANYLFLLFTLLSTSLYAEDHKSKDDCAVCDELGIQREEQLRPPTKEKGHHHRKKSSFSFWFQFPPKKNKQDNHRHVFDEMVILNKNKDILLMLSNNQISKDSFRREIKLIDLQIDHCVEQLKTLLDGQEQGINNSEAIVMIYSKIFELSELKYITIKNHSDELLRFFDEMATKQYAEIREQIKDAEKDPQALTDSLLDKYQDFK